MLFHTSLNVSEIIWGQKISKLVQHSMITQSLLCEAQKSEQPSLREYA